MRAVLQRCRLPARAAKQREEAVERRHQLLDLTGQLAEQTVLVEEVRHAAEQVAEQPLALIRREVQDDRLRVVRAAAKCRIGQTACALCAPVAPVSEAGIVTP
jgi:hypothetical protein